jgi:hypothetical protein
MARPENYTDGGKAKKILSSIAELKKEADALSEEWMEVADTLAREGTGV